MTPSESGASVPRCTRCVLSARFPGVQFDASGLCSFCRSQPSSDELAIRRQQVIADIEALVAGAATSGGYQVVVAYSGGKDSSYLLWLLAERFGARCLAVTVDNGFVSPTAFENCRRVLDSLGVDHLIYRPNFGFMKRVYRESLKGEVHVPAARARASDVCNSCIKLINIVMVKTAVRHGCRIVAGGYIGAQVPRDGAMLEVTLSGLVSMGKFPLQTFSRRFGPEADRFYSYDDILPLVKEDDRIRIINPLLAIDYSEDEVIRRISELGWHRPPDTGVHSSNCQINDVGIVSHVKRYGFHPYEAELSDQVRRGTMSRDEALKRVETMPEETKVIRILERLEMTADDLT